LWALYILSEKGLDTDEEWLEKLKLLGQLKVVDQAVFPCILNETEGSELKACEAYSISGNFNDLRWMKEAISQGYAMNWPQVGEAWRKSFVTDAPAFADVLALVPDKTSCLQALSRANLTRLIESYRSPTFAKEVVSSLPDDDNDLADSPYFVAAWYLLRNYTQCVEKGTAKESFVNDAWAMPKDKILRILSWARRYCYNYRGVDGDSKERESTVRKLLLRETKTLLAKTSNSDKHGIQQIVDLWSQSFACLLYFDNEDDVQLLKPVVFWAAASQFPPNDDWCRAVRIVGAILHREATGSDVEWLLETDPLGRRLFEKWQANEVIPEFGLETKRQDPTASNKSKGQWISYIPDQFLPGLLHLVNGVSLSGNIQERILRQVPGVELPDCKDIVALLEAGLNRLYALDDLTVQPGPGRTCLVEALQHRLRQRTPVMRTIQNPAAANEQAHKHRLRTYTESIRRLSSADLSSSEKQEAILRYYNPYVGQSFASQGAELEKPLDKNPEGAEYDLGRRGAFQGRKLIVAMLVRQEELVAENSVPNMIEEIRTSVVREVKAKGFADPLVVQTEQEFIDRCDDYDVAWIISGTGKGGFKKTDVLHEHPFFVKLMQFHQAGKGIALMAENDPLHFHASCFLMQLFQDQKYQPKGNDKAGQTLRVGSAADKGRFEPHMLTAGLVELHEGDTISSLDIKGQKLATSYQAQLPLELRILANSSAGRACVLYADVSGDRKNPAGRILVDCGYTKFLKCVDVGVARFMSNISVWLLGIDYQIGESLENWPRRGGHLEPLKPVVDAKSQSRNRLFLEQYFPANHTVFLIDVSSSMDSPERDSGPAKKGSSGRVMSRLDAALAGMKAYAEQRFKKRSDAEDKISVVFFGSNATPVVETKVLNAQLLEDIDKLRVPLFGRGTDFNNAFIAVKQLLDRHPEDSDCMLMFLTDGEDTFRKDIVKNVTQNRPTMTASFYMYGSDEKAHSTLQAMASLIGASVTLVQSGQELMDSFIAKAVSWN
jgi:hypothetical protein